MRVFLAELATDAPAWEYSISSRENLGLGYLAAVARAAGHEAEIVSGPALGLTSWQVIEAARRFAPSVVGVSLPFTDELAPALKALSMLAGNLGPDVAVIVGGHAATASFRDVLDQAPSVRAVVLGEGEVTFREVIERIGEGRDILDVPGLAVRASVGYRVTPRRELIKGLDTLPFPARDLLLAKRRAGKDIGEIFIAGSRGCPYRCSFCDIKTFYKNGEGVSWRARSPSNIVEELRRICAEFGTKPVYCFVDDQFFGPGNRGRVHAHELADRLIDADLGLSFEITCRADSVDREVFEHLKRAGLAGAYIGLDSGSQVALDRFQKDITVARNIEAVRTLRELELAVDFGFIMFDPWTTRDDLLANLSFLRDLIKIGVVLHPAMLQNGLKLYPNTPIAQRALGDGFKASVASRGLVDQNLEKAELQDQFRQIVSELSDYQWSDAVNAASVLVRLEDAVLAKGKRITLGKRSKTLLAQL